MLIEKKFIKYNYTNSNNRKIEYIVLHDTGNTSKGANADAHYRYFNGGNRGVSAHYFIDDVKALQIIDDKNIAWHCGKKYTSTVEVTDCNNFNSIGVEVCVNEDGDLEKAIANTIELIKFLMREYKIDLSHVITHKQATGKECPSTLYKLGYVDRIKKELVKMDIPQWKLDACNKFIARIGLDNTWKEKLQDTATVSDVMIIINKALDAIENVKIKVGE